MAVEARRLNIFPSQILRSRGAMMAMNGIEGIGNAGYAPLLSGTTTATDNFIPMYAEKCSEIKSDSGLSYAVPVSRKRSRDAMAHHHHSSAPNGVVSNQVHRGGSLAFLGEDFSFQFQQQQQEIDGFIAQHTEKLRVEVEERWKRYSRRVSAAVEENVMKRLRAKEDEIVNMGKINWALEERVKSLCVENQIWRELAQTNEATANALRCNLEQVLAQVQDEEAALDEDAQSSCCGSNFKEERERMCRSCGKEESCVLLLPCRHLCLCTFCGSSIQACPVCNSTQTATVHVNLSPV